MSSLNYLWVAAGTSRTGRQRSHDGIQKPNMQIAMQQLLPCSWLSFDRHRSSLDASPVRRPRSGAVAIPSSKIINFETIFSGKGIHSLAGLNVLEFLAAGDDVGHDWDWGLVRSVVGAEIRLDWRSVVVPGIVSRGTSCSLDGVRMPVNEGALTKESQCKQAHKPEVQSSSVQYLGSSDRTE